MQVIAFGVWSEDIKILYLLDFRCLLDMEVERVSSLEQRLREEIQIWESSANKGYLKQWEKGSYKVLEMAGLLCSGSTG
jgi:hypothetical protein